MSAISEQQLEQAALELVQEAIAADKVRDLCEDLAIHRGDAQDMYELSQCPLDSDNYRMWFNAMRVRLLNFEAQKVRERAEQNQQQREVTECHEE